jgi:hypothetical protein
MKKPIAFDPSQFINNNSEEENEQHRAEVIANSIMYQAGGNFISDFFNKIDIELTRQRKVLTDYIKSGNLDNNTLKDVKHERDYVSTQIKKYRQASKDILKAAEAYEKIISTKTDKGTKEADNLESIHNVLLNIFSQMGRIFSKNDFSSESKAAFMNPLEGEGNFAYIDGMLHEIREADYYIPGKTVVLSGIVYNFPESEQIEGLTVVKGQKYQAITEI